MFAFILFFIHRFFYLHADLFWQLRLLLHQWVNLRCCNSQRQSSQPRTIWWPKQHLLFLLPQRSFHILLRRVILVSEFGDFRCFSNIFNVSIVTIPPFVLVLLDYAFIGHRKPLILIWAWAGAWASDRVSLVLDKVFQPITVPFTRPSFLLAPLIVLLLLFREDYLVRVYSPSGWRWLAMWLLKTLLLVNLHSKFVLVFLCPIRNGRSNVDTLLKFNRVPDLSWIILWANLYFGATVPSFLLPLIPAFRSINTRFNFLLFLLVLLDATEDAGGNEKENDDNCDNQGKYIDI